MLIRIAAVAAILAASPALAGTVELTPAEAQRLLNIMARAEIKGAEAPEFMALAAKINAIITPPPAPVGTTEH